MNNGKRFKGKEKKEESKEGLNLTYIRSNVMKNYNLNFGAYLLKVNLLPLLKQVVTIVHIILCVKKK